MAGPVEVEQHYLVPTHLRAQQSIGPFPARFILPLGYAGVFAGVPLAVSAWHATNGLIPPTVAAGLAPPLLVSPVAAWWLDPPFEHGVFAAAAFVKRAYVRPQPRPVGLVAVYRMPTINLETASAPLRRQARAQWGSILNGLTHPIKIVVRGRPLTTLPVVEQLRRDPKPVARSLGAWLETQLSMAGLIERDRLLVIPADDEAELEFRADALEKVLRQARLQAERVDPAALPLLRTLTWDPKATAPRDEPEVMEEGTTEVQADGWWTRAYALGEFPSAILTNWLSPLLAGDEAVDVAIDVLPQDAGDIKTWVLQPKINQLSTSSPSRKRLIALEQLGALYDAIERRRVAPFEVAHHGAGPWECSPRRARAVQEDRAARPQHGRQIEPAALGAGRGSAPAGPRAHQATSRPGAPDRDWHTRPHIPLVGQLPADGRRRRVGRSRPTTVPIHPVQPDQ